MSRTQCYQMSGLLLHTPYNNVSQVILTGKQYSTYGLAHSLPFYSLEKGSNRDTYTVAYLLCLGPWKAMCNLQMICKMIGFKLWTIRSQFAHTHGMYRYVCKYHSNDNVKRASLKLILTFLNVKFFFAKIQTLHRTSSSQTRHDTFFHYKVLLYMKKKAV